MIHEAVSNLATGTKLDAIGGRVVGAMGEAMSEATRKGLNGAMGKAMGEATRKGLSGAMGKAMGEATSE